MRDEKSSDLEKQKNLNQKIQVIVSQKDTIKNETAGLRADYLNSILNNMKSQQDELKEILEGIEQDTLKIKKEKDIQVLLQQMTQGIVALGQQLLKERLQKQAELDDELAAEKHRNEVQNRIIDQINDKIKQLQRIIEEL